MSLVAAMELVSEVAVLVSSEVAVVMVGVRRLLVVFLLLLLFVGGGGVFLSPFTK